MKISLDTKTFWFHNTKTIWGFVLIGCYKTERTFQITFCNMVLVFNFYKGPSNAQ